MPKKFAPVRHSSFWSQFFKSQVAFHLPDCHGQKSQQNREPKSSLAQKVKTRYCWNVAIGVGRWSNMTRLIFMIQERPKVPGCLKKWTTFSASRQSWSPKMKIGYLELSNNLRRENDWLEDKPEKQRVWNKQKILQKIETIKNSLRNVNAKFNSFVVRRLRKYVRCKRSSLWLNENWVISQGPPHVAIFYSNASSLFLRLDIFRSTHDVFLFLKIKINF